MSLLARVLFLILMPIGAWALTESHGYLGLENTTYFGRLVSDPETGSYSSLNGNYQGRISSRAWGEAQANAGALVFLEGYSPLLNVREAFVATPQTKQWVGAKLSLGRKLERWSEVDRLWKTGVWQPRFRWDYLHPEEQGLTGIFLEVHEPDIFRFVAYGSPLFIPELGPPTQAVDGKIVSQSPWASQPATQVKLLGRETPVTYSIPDPDASEIVRNPGGALMMELGSLQRGAWFRAATAYKPVNQMMISVRPNLQPRERVSASQSATSLHTAIEPHVAYHYVYEVSAGYQTKRIGSSLSLLKERPILKELSPLVIAQQIAPSFMIVPAVGYNFGRSERDQGRVELSWLRRWGGNAPDAGELADPDFSPFEPRLLFTNAVSVSLETPMYYSALGGLRYHGQTIYESAGQGLMVSNTLTLQTRKSWSVFVGIDLLGQIGDSEDEERESLISRYRENDRIHGGITYVF